MHLGQRDIDARHVADAERDRHRIEALVRKRQRLGIGIDERHRIVEAASLARSRPTPSMSALMSATVARVPAPPAATVRNDTSPVPPATSSSAKSRRAFRQEAGAAFRAD